MSFLGPSRARRFAGRIGDPDYRVFLRADAEARLLLRRQLSRLGDYHGGRHADFTRTRDRYLNRIIRHARERSPGYSERLQHLPGNDVSPLSPEWHATPLLTKAEIQTRLDELTTMPVDHPLVGHLTTGGSTGQPLGFPYLGGHDGEHQEFFWRQLGYRTGDRILAMDGTVVPEADLAAGRFWTRKGPDALPYGGMSLSAHYWSERTRGDYLNFLLDYRPDFIRGYPSFVSDVASHLDARGLRLACKAVQLTSESHTARQTEIIERTMGPVRDQYGHAEASIFGYSLHADGPIFCSPLYGLVEVLDEEDAPVKEGASGEVVVTGFHNYALPFIRYRTGDLAVVAGRQGGIVRLRWVQGRTQDVVISGDGTRHLVTALVFGQHFRAFDRIHRWQILQETRGKVLIRVVPDASFSVADEAEIATAFQRIAGIEVDLKRVTDIPRTPRGKSPLVIQKTS